ncbi:hypothetical protein PM082_018562 [Marasmius tenuissimus]|nr:hypothetical protein PM082_018562 [Marasmius tenuissimus]
MKTIALGIIGFMSLAAQAAVITLVEFGELSPPGTSTLSGGFAVPIGTNGAETTYVLNGGGDTETGAGDGGLVTFTHTPSAIKTIVASASGYKGGWEATGIDGLVHTADTECRYTGKDVGECVIAVDDGATDATAVTLSGPATAFFVVTVSETSAAAPTGGNSGGATPTGGASGGAAPTTGGNGNNTSSGDQKDQGGALGLLMEKQLMLTVGGLVLGALTVF